MMFIICCRLTPSFAVRMTITSVVFGDGAAEGVWADDDGDCATAATGYAESMNGGKNFMDAPRVNVFRLLVSGGYYSGNVCTADKRSAGCLLCPIAGSC